MDTLERELRRTLRSVHTDRQVPADLHRRLRRRTRRGQLRRGGATLTGIVGAVALVIAGGVFVGEWSRPAPIPGIEVRTERPPATVSWSDGRVTVNRLLDDGVAADSVVGFVDSTHVVVSPLGVEWALSIRMQYVDLETGKATRFLTLPGRVRRAGYDGGLTGSVYVWADRGTIHAVDIRSGERWDVGRLDQRAEQENDQNKPQFVVGSGYAVWRDYTEHDQKVYAAPVRGGEPRRLPGIAATDVLRIDAGRLVAYDGRRVRVLDLATGRVLAQRPFARVRSTNQLFPATCGARYCVRGKEAPEGAADAVGGYSNDAAVPEVMRISDGRTFEVPDAPTVVNVVERDSKGRVMSEGEPSDPQVVAGWLTFSTGTRSSGQTSYLFDIDGRKLDKIGRGQLHVTDDGHLVRAPSLRTDYMKGSSAPDVEVRYAELPR